MPTYRPPAVLSLDFSALRGADHLGVGMLLLIWNSHMAIPQVLTLARRILAIATEQTIARVINVNGRVHPVFLTGHVAPPGRH